MTAQSIPLSEGRWPRICEKPARMAPDTRIAMLSFHTSPLAALGRSRDAGGMNVYVRELAAALGRQHTAVDIFTRWTDPDLPQIIPLTAHVRLIHIPAGPIAPIAKGDLFAYVPQFIAGVECFAISERLDYHVIHSHYWLSGVAGVELARRWGAPHLAMFHTLARLKQQARPAEQETALRIEQEHHLIQETDGVIVATNDEREQIARLYGLPRQAMYIVPCGVDLRQFASGDKRAARRQLAHVIGADDEPLILFVGRLDPLKGADLLVDVLPLLQTPAILAIVGGDAHDSERAHLRRQARRLGVAHRIRFIDAVPQEELSTYYRAADVFAVASHYESFGLVAVEALACGAPVIAPRVGGLPAIIRDGVNGVLVDQRQPVAYAARLDALLRDPARRARLAANARPSVERFSWDTVAAQVAQVYDELLVREPALVALD